MIIIIQEFVYSEKNIEEIKEKPQVILSNKKRKIKKLREFLIEKLFFLTSLLSAIMVIIVFGFIVIKSLKVFNSSGLGFITDLGFDMQIFQSSRGEASVSMVKFGAFGLIMGTLLTSIGALLISVPIGVLSAVVITELSPKWLRRPLQTIVRYLASIPSIIYGLIGVLVIVEFIKSFITPEMQASYVSYFLMTGKSYIAGVILLSIMILPIITALTIDSLKSVPKRYKEASYALGLSKWRTIVKVLIPSAKSGIFAGVILAVGVAVGESIALKMVIGGIPMVPDPSKCVNPFDSLLTPILTLASAIVNKSETLSDPYSASALFACGVVLLITCVILSFMSKIVNYIVKRRMGLE